MRTAGIKTVLVAIVACNSLSFAFDAHSLQAAERTSRIAGIVVDVNGSRVVGASIRIENADTKQIVRSDSEGRFDVEVPPGSYEITVDQSGFKRFQLPGFRVGAETCELVGIHLEVAPPKMPVKVK